MSSDYVKTIEIESNRTYDLNISELKYIKIIKGDHTDFDHLQMIQYINMIVDDVLIFGKDIKVRFIISINNHVLNLEFDYLYPFINGLVIFMIDLSKIVSIKNILKTLDYMIEFNSQRNEQINYTDLSKRSVYTAVNIVDNALSYDGKLKDVFSKRSLFNESIKFSFFDMTISNYGIGGIELRSEMADIYFFVDQFKTTFVIDEDRYNWHFTNDDEFDTISIRQLFILYLSKKLKRPVIDLQREIKLIEMEMI